MMVASRLPSLNAFMAATMESAGRPARRATGEPATGAPAVPWHMAQPPAIDATPFGVRFGAANVGAGGAGCCASAAPANAAASNANRVLMPALLCIEDIRK